MRQRFRPVVEAVLGSGVADGFAGNRRRECGLACSRRLPHYYEHTQVKTLLTKQHLQFENLLLRRAKSRSLPCDCCVLVSLGGIFSG